MAELREIPLPDFLQEMTEFRMIDEISDKKFEELDDEIDLLHEDITIGSASERGIARREKILGIMTNPEEDLESRRARVLFWWYNKMPYSFKVIESKIAALCGANNYTISYDPDEEILSVGIGLDLGWNVIQSVQHLLDDIVMLNVIIDVRGTALEEIRTNLYAGTVLHSYVVNSPLYDNV